LKTFCACTESPDLIHWFSKNDSSGDTIPLMQLFLSIDLSLTIFARQYDGQRYCTLLMPSHPDLNRQNLSGNSDCFVLKSICPQFQVRNCPVKHTFYQCAALKREPRFCLKFSLTGKFGKGIIDIFLKVKCPSWKVEGGGGLRGSLRCRGDC
jgi:hypothetical protein